MPNLREAREFYPARLGRPSAWVREGGSAGPKRADSDTELVLVEGPGALERDLKVRSGDGACRVVESAGGTLASGPFDTPLGRCAVVRDPWTNHRVLPDSSWGRLTVDASGHVIA